MGGGGYCFGGGGRDISLSNSDPGNYLPVYILRAVRYIPQQARMAGLLTLVIFYAAGVYTVVANNGSCTANIAGQCYHNN